MVKKKKAKVVKMLSPENYIRQKARTLPIHECWVNKDWQEDGLANLTIARKHTNGNFTIGVYLVDLKCLGVKDAHYFFNIFLHEYQEILEHSNQRFESEKISYTLAHNIIYAGLEYAEDYGFVPHKDFEIAKYIIEEDTEEIELMEIQCGGEDGQPLYIRGPLDNDIQAAQIIAQLEKSAGPGNYHFIDGYLFNDEEEFDDEIGEYWDDDEAEDDFSLEFDKNEMKNSSTYVFKIQIQGITKPPVWRKISVPSYYSFKHFHHVIQASFGWTNSHLFQFSEKGYGSQTIITEIYDDFDDFSGNKVEAADIKLSEVFKTEKQKHFYIYDFGDDWTHIITLEKIIPDTSSLPVCLDGKGKCPPEDCGGVGGYENIKEILQDKTHPEHEEYLEWLGLENDENWDPGEFDLAETIEELQLYFQNE